MNKKGEFFILTAVIISAVLVSLAVIKNEVVSNSEPDSFYDLTYEIKEESARVIDYGINNDSVDVITLMDEFSEDIAQSIQNSDPDIEIIFIFGNLNNVTIKNYGRDSANVPGLYEENSIEAGLSDIESSINLNIGGTLFKRDTSADYSLFDEDLVSNYHPGTQDIKITINNKDYTFTLTNDQQFFIIVKKSIGGENYVDVR